MATTLSSPTPPLSNPQAATTTTDLEARLDAQITLIKSQIADIQSQTHNLSTKLLNSNGVKAYVESRRTTLSTRNSNENRHSDGRDVLQQRLEDALAKSRVKNDTRFYRLAAGVTAFPWSTEDRASGGDSDRGMLGVRFDLSVPRFRANAGSASRSGLGKRKRGLENGLPDVDAAVHAGQPEKELQGHEVQSASEDKHQANQAYTQPEIDSTYFLILRRLQHNGTTYLKVHQHTIPKHIDVDAYADQYLPLPTSLLAHDDTTTIATDTDTDSPLNAAEVPDSFVPEDDSGIDVTQDIQALNPNQTTGTNTNPHNPISTINITTNNQTLHTFARALRDDLQNWWNRLHSIRYLQYCLFTNNTNTTTSTTSTTSTTTTTQQTPSPRYSIKTLHQPTHDARHLRIEWTNGALGHIRIDNNGTIAQVKVFRRRTRHTAATDVEAHQSIHAATDLDVEASPTGAEDEAAGTDELRAAQSRRDDRTDGRVGEMDREDEGDERGEGYVRQHTVERLLRYDEQDGQRPVRIDELMSRLKVVHERVIVTPE